MDVQRDTDMQENWDVQWGVQQDLDVQQNLGVQTGMDMQWKLEV